MRESVLVWAGIQLIFLITGTVLYFGFKMRMMLIISWWAVLAQCQGLSCLSSHQWTSWGCTRGCEGKLPGQVTPNDERDIPSHMASWSPYKLGENWLWAAYWKLAEHQSTYTEQWHCEPLILYIIIILSLLSPLPFLSY